MNKKYSLLIIFLLLVLIDVFLIALDYKSSRGVLTFAMLDVGQGDALFIESPSGVQILFDGGSVRKVLNPLRKIISPFDRTIDAIVITNPDADHIGGLTDILKNYKVDYVFEPGTQNSSKTYKNLKALISSEKIPQLLVRKGMQIDLGGGAAIEILFPDREVKNWSTNDGSIVARLTYGQTAIMLSGDSTSKTEKIILENNSTESLKSQILKIGHHGSRSSTSKIFAGAVAPEYALISLGAGNSYGHPHPEVLDTLEDFGVQILRTDELGTIVFSCDRMAVCEIN